MNLSLASVYGSSADMIAWTQQNLSGHWGLQGQGQPLHRSTDPILIDDNRGIICDSSFVPDQNIINDRNIGERGSGLGHDNGHWYTDPHRAVRPRAYSAVAKHERLCRIFGGPEGIRSDRPARL